MVSPVKGDVLKNPLAAGTTVKGIVSLLQEKAPVRLKADRDSGD